MWNSGILLIVNTYFSVKNVLPPKVDWAPAPMEKGEERRRERGGGGEEKRKGEVREREGKGREGKRKGEGR